MSPVPPKAPEVREAAHPAKEADWEPLGEGQGRGSIWQHTGRGGA
jgi:hypothetical protein